MNEGGLGHLVLVDTQMLDDNFLHAISDIAHVLSSFSRASAQKVFQQMPALAQAVPAALIAGYSTET